MEQIRWGRKKRNLSNWDSSNLADIATEASSAGVLRANALLKEGIARVDQNGMSQRSSISVIQGYFASAAPSMTKQPGGETRPRTYQELTLQAHQRSSGAALQSSGNKRVFAVPPHLANFGRRTGQKLPPAVQQKMESFFSTSFSNVQVHSGPEASAIGALAFTTGSN